jgi:hypothetical protein
LGTLKFTWHGDKVGNAALPGIRDARDRRLLVLGTFNATQFAPAEVLVAFPLPDGQGKAEIDLSKPMVVIIQQDVLEKRMIGRLERYRLNFQGPVPDGVFHLGPIGPKKAGSLHICSQGSGHHGKVRFDHSKGSLEVLFKVSESASSDFKAPLEFCVRGDVRPGGQPLQFMLHVSGESEKRLLWQGSALQEGDGIAFRGWVQQKAIQESARALEALRWPLYSYEENSWAWVLLALLQTLSESAKHTASYAL